MAIKTKYSFDQLYRAYKEQYEKSESQLGVGVMPNREMYSKSDFIADWAAIKQANKGMSGIRVAEKLARSDVYLYSKKQSESIYKSVYSQEYEEFENLQKRIDIKKEEINRLKNKEVKISVEEEIKALEKEKNILRKQQSAFAKKIRTGTLSEAEEEKLNEFYQDISDYYHDLKKLGYTSKEIKAKVARKYFSWKYV